MAEWCRAVVQRLEGLDLAPSRGHQELAELMGGSIRIDATETKSHQETKKAAWKRPFYIQWALRAQCDEEVVAGARFGNYLLRLPRG